MTVLSIWHGKIRFILKKINQKYVVFSIRDILITPRRLNYAREKERILYDSLVDLTNSKQNEIQRLILQAISDIKETLADHASILDISGRSFETINLFHHFNYVQESN